MIVLPSEKIPENWATWEGRGKGGNNSLADVNNGEKECSFEGCGFGVISKNLCSGHYQQKFKSKLKELKSLHYGKNTAKTLTTEQIKETLTLW